MVTFSFSAKKSAKWYHLVIFKGRILQISLQSTNSISGIVCMGEKRNIIFFFFFLDVFLLPATFIVTIRGLKTCKLLRGGEMFCADL